MFRARVAPRGTYVSDIFAEVDEDLRAERAKKLLQKYGVLLIAAAVLVVACVGAWQAFRYYEKRETARVAEIFLTAMRGAETAGAAERDQALTGLDQVAREGGAGYRALARLRAAAIRFDKGDRDAALALWDQVSADAGADPLLRDLAALQFVWHQIDTGNAAMLAARLAKLTIPGNGWRPLAEEAQALLDLREGRRDAARDILKRLSQDTTAPDGVRGRAGGLLSRLGGQE